VAAVRAWGERRRRGDRGAVAVEFGLIAPFLFLLIFGLIDFGWMFSRDMVVQNVARDSVRVASLEGSYAQVSDTIQTELAAYGIAPSQVTYSITCKNASGTVCANNPTSYNATATSGSSVKVTISYTHNLMTPVGALCSLFGGGCTGNTVVLAKTAEMVRE
jgi:Flp pilus assembly protein TadG